MFQIRGTHPRCLVYALQMLILLMQIRGRVHVHAFCRIMTAIWSTSKTTVLGTIPRAIFDKRSKLFPRMNEL